VQDRLEPLVVSWGWESETPGHSQFIDYHEWQGTRDLAAFLAAPAAIEFQHQHDWDTVRHHSRALASETRRRLNALTGLDPICPDSPEWFTQMVTIRLPRTDLDGLKSRLYQEYRIEAPLFKWNDQHFLRLSFQGYNSHADADTLVQSLTNLLREAQPAAPYGQT